MRHHGGEDSDRRPFEAIMIERWGLRVGGGLILAGCIFIAYTLAFMVAINLLLGILVGVLVMLTGTFIFIATRS